MNAKRREQGYPTDEGSNSEGFWGSSREALADKAAGRSVVDRPAAFGRAKPSAAKL